MAITVQHQPGAGAVGGVALAAGQGEYQKYLDNLNLQQQQIDQRDRMQIRDITEAQRAQKYGIGAQQQNLVYTEQQANARFVTDKYADRFSQIASFAQQNQQAQKQRQFDSERIQYQTAAQIYRDNLAQQGRVDLQQRGAAIDWAARQQGADLQQQGYEARDAYDFEQNRERSQAQWELVHGDPHLRDIEKQDLERRILLSQAGGGPDSLPSGLRPPPPEPDFQPVAGPDGQARNWPGTSIPMLQNVNTGKVETAEIDAYYKNQQHEVFLAKERRDQENARIERRAEMRQAREATRLYEQRQRETDARVYQAAVGVLNSPTSSEEATNAAKQIVDKFQGSFLTGHSIGAEGLGVGPGVDPKGAIPGQKAGGPKAGDTLTVRGVQFVRTHDGGWVANRGQRAANEVY